MSNKNDMTWIDPILKQIGDIAKAKNNDYADGQGWSGNFDKYGIYGMMARLHDKVQRAENLLLRGTKAQVDEKVEDTLIDLATYALLVMQAHKEGMDTYGIFQSDD